VEQQDLLARTMELEQETSKTGFAKKYAEFMALAADHITVIGPFIPALTQMITNAL